MFLLARFQTRNLYLPLRLVTLTFQDTESLGSPIGERGLQKAKRHLPKAVPCLAEVSLQQPAPGQGEVSPAQPDSQTGLTMRTGRWCPRLFVWGDVGLGDGLGSPVLSSKQGKGLGQKHAGGNKRGQKEASSS